MIARLRYLRTVATRSRAPLPPVALALFLLVGTFVDPRNDPGDTWALTSLICFAMTALIVSGVLAGEPAAQADVAATALGGRRGRTKLDLTLAAVVATVLSALFVAYPLVLAAVTGRDVLLPHPSVGDVVAATLGHLAASGCGGGLGVLLAPPRVRRRASASVGVLAFFLGSVALGSGAPAWAGPPGVATELQRADHGAELLAIVTCLVLAAMLLAISERWAARRG